MDHLLPPGFVFDEQPLPPPPSRRLVGEVVNEHGRRYPRTLQQAFKQSEGYRNTIYGPPPKQSNVAWIVAVGLVLWLMWIAAHVPVQR